jgi:serine phosphatase RsbU (regulator of sigma subunit)
MLGAAAAHTSLKAHAAYPHSAGALLTKVNECVTAASPGGKGTSVAQAIIELESGQIELAIAGASAAFVVGAGCQESLTSNFPPIGEMCDFVYATEGTRLGPGQAFVLISPGVTKAVDALGQQVVDAALASFISKNLAESAEGIAAAIRQLLLHEAQLTVDMSVVVVKRKAR